MKLILTRGSKAGFQLPLSATIKNYEGTLYHVERSLPHPGAVINTRWRKLLDAIDAFLDAYERNQAAEEKPLFSYMSLYKNVLYEATEFIEAMTDNLKECFLPQNKYSQWKPDALRRWRQHPTVACNKLKHNDNVMVGVKGDYVLGKVRGYGICEYYLEATRPNPHVHKDAKPLAFGIDLRRILVHIYLISQAISKEIERICPLPDEVQNFETLSEADEKILRRVALFMPSNFHHYTSSQNIPIFKFDEDKLEISDDGGQTIPMRGGSIATVSSGDGYTKTFHFF